jgi:hypothetical protein
MASSRVLATASKLAEDFESLRRVVDEFIAGIRAGS